MRSGNKSAVQPYMAICRAELMLLVVVVARLMTRIKRLRSRIFRAVRPHSALHHHLSRRLFPITLNELLSHCRRCPLERTSKVANAVTATFQAIIHGLGYPRLPLAKIFNALN